MGCWVSKIERKETVSRCKARKRYMKQLVKARQAFSTYHAMYLRALRSTGAALVEFSTNETSLQKQYYHLPQLQRPLSPQPQSRPQMIHPSPLPPPPPLRPPMSPSTTDTWTSSTMTSPLPPPPPPPPSSTWDFWDPFVPASAPPSTAYVAEEGWEEEELATTVSDVAITRSESVAAPPSLVSGSELAVVPRNGKDLGEIAKEFDDYFLKAADAGAELSAILEVSSCGFETENKVNKVYNYACTLNPSSWTWGSTPTPRMNMHRVRMGQVGENNGGNGRVISDSHHCTVERLYAWEQKLFNDVKNWEALKKEHERRVGQLRKLELKGSNYMKTEKTKKEVEKLESQMIVASQAIETISTEIIKVRETQLYPQLLDLVKGMKCMWRSMYESHQVQMHIAQQLKYVNTMPSSEQTSEIHRQSTLQLELQVQQWHQSFCNLIKAQQDYIQSLTGWLRLSLFQFNKSPLSGNSQESGIYTLCEEWQQAVDRIPDKVASEGIKGFLTVIHAIVLQQTDEHKQKKKADSVSKDFEKKSAELRSLEGKYGLFSMPDSSGKDPVAEKRVKVETLRTRAEEEKTKHEKSVNVTRAMTMNNLQMGFPHVFQAMVGFSSVCMEAFESVYNEAKHICQEHDVKRILPNGS